MGVYFVNNTGRSTNFWEVKFKFVALRDMYEYSNVKISMYIVWFIVGNSELFKVPK